MSLWGIVGRKDMGKTTLTVALVEELTARGLVVSTLKRTHHALDLETPGTDSHRHRAAGAAQTMLVSDARITVMEEVAEPSLLHALTRLSPCDVVLAEGWKAGRHRRIEVWRPGGAAPLAAGDPSIAVVAAPGARAPVEGVVLDLDDVGAVADWMLAWTTT
ncbi:molybdopterin-guanine dinucleotide biosynthesis protein B [Jannaschia sp. Os4]|uniref:molybdopterin-guanine dinucleotide biosynthesis protein B n=1 Tax=Jannaschia sp. Os4 TaxID=2807617 RepID=UPI0019394D2A|nr:molybdopterin-guanine dinucleotide biosynthesis protein B [Jannaschia sp. Os4]MBM2576151.1 molybdopterin-guanine dinucleotide biosynthesis protein B [Jannaschia sp. Os4]